MKGGAVTRVAGWIALYLAAAAVCAPWGPPLWADAPASRPATSPATAEQIDRLIEQLGDADYHVREAATRRLWEIGAPAAAALRRAAAGDDLEVVERARRVLRGLRCGLRPDSPPEIARLAARCVDAKIGEHRDPFHSLLNRGMEGCRTALRLWEAEDDPKRREPLTALLPNRADRLAQILLLDGRPRDAEQMLERGAMERRNLAFLRHHAAWHVTAGSLGAAIRKWEAADPTPTTAAILAHLHRAAGDLGRARAAAEKSDRPRLLESIAVEQGDWKTAARLCRTRCGEKPSSATVGQLAAYHRLAGNPEPFRKAVERLGQFTKRYANAAEALVINDCVDEAVALCRKADDHAWAFELLVARMQYAEALQLDVRPVLRARLLHTLGQTDKARAVLQDALDRETEPRRLAGLLDGAARFELAQGRRHAARKHWGRMLALEEGARHLDGMLALLWPGRGRRGRMLWRLLRSESPDEPCALALGRLEQTLVGKLPGPPLLGLANRVRAAWTHLKEHEQRSWLGGLADAAKEAGLLDLAARFAGELADRTGEQSDLSTAGELLAELKRWPEAARRYRAAWEAEPPYASLLWGYGLALSRSGRKAAGERRMRLACHLPLADGWRRALLADVLEAHGRDQEADAQRRAILRTADTADFYYVRALSWRARKARADGAHRLEASCRELQRQGSLSESVRFTTARYSLLAGVRVYEARMRGHLAAGRWAEAVAALGKARHLLPGGIDVSIHLIGRLDRAGQRPRADAVFAEVFEFHQGLCRRWPDSAHLHNNTAWLAARCRRRLDEALRHATRAVALAPKEAGRLDTLAEVQFQRGRQDKAIALMNQCIRLADEKTYFRKQLARFRDGDRASDPPAH
jgi:tetratricopeptide (TPR) repeat protein